jgi:hypothetical protein
MSNDPNGKTSECERLERLLEEYMAGDIAPADIEALRQHTKACPGCRRLMDLHCELSRIPGQVELPTDGDFGEMRASVLGQVGRSAARRRRGAQPVWMRWRQALASRPAYPVGFAIGFLILGFFLGRSGAGRGVLDQDVFVDEVVRQASLERGIAGYWDSPFVYSNVSLSPRDDRTVTLDFDVTRHVTVTRAIDSPLTREILVYAMIDPSPMGRRLTAMGVAGKTMDEKLREALVFILLNDPSLPVRLRSLEILTQYASDPVVQDALLSSLSQDLSVQVRLLALESLAEERRDPVVIRRALGEPLDSNDRAVLHRAVELMGES